MSDSRHRPSIDQIPFQPSRQQVAGLIKRAKQHPLGLDYLKNGDLSSVSATFKTNAFVVDSARSKLTGPTTSSRLSELTNLRRPR